MTDRPLLQLWGGRKFVMCCAFGVAFCLMYLLGPLSEAAFERLIGGTVVVYIAGNVLQKKQVAP